MGLVATFYRTYSLHYNASNLGITAWITRWVWEYRRFQLHMARLSKSCTRSYWFYSDLSNPFYSFVDTFYIVGEGNQRINLRLVGAVPKQKRLNVGCYTSFAVDFPFGTQIYHDRDFQYPVNGRHLECAHRVYFVKYCPHNLYGYCFNEKLKVFNLTLIKSRKVFDRINQSFKTEL